MVDLGCEVVRGRKKGEEWKINRGWVGHVGCAKLEFLEFLESHLYMVGISCIFVLCFAFSPLGSCQEIV